MAKLRLATSGAVLKNAQGGYLDLGTGAMLRLAEGYTVVGGTLQITTTPQTLGSVLDGGTVLVQELDSPDANLRYRASLSVDVVNDNTSTSAEVVLFIDTSVDNGVTWDEQVNNSHFLGAGSGSAGSAENGMHCRLDMTMRLGSALVGGIPAETLALKVRGRIAVVGAVTGAEVDSRGSSASYNAFVGTCLLQLSEHF
jgi:hypothetical protein